MTKEYAVLQAERDAGRALSGASKRIRSLEKSNAELREVYRNDLARVSSQRDLYLKQKRRADKRVEELEAECVRLRRLIGEFDA